MWPLVCKARDIPISLNLNRWPPFGIQRVAFKLSVGLGCDKQCVLLGAKEVNLWGLRLLKVEH